MDATITKFRYVNYKGRDAIRTVRPIRIWFGCTAFHREPQWLLEAFDLDKKETRDFALAGISEWGDTQHSLCDSKEKGEGLTPPHHPTET